MHREGLAERPRERRAEDEVDRTDREGADAPEPKRRRRGGWRRGGGGRSGCLAGRVRVLMRMGGMLRGRGEVDWTVAPEAARWGGGEAGGGAGCWRRGVGGAVACAGTERQKGGRCGGRFRRRGRLRHGRRWQGGWRRRTKRWREPSENRTRGKRWRETLAGTELAGTELAGNAGIGTEGFLGARCRRCTPVSEIASHTAGIARSVAFVRKSLIRRGARCGLFITSYHITLQTDSILARAFRAIGAPVFLPDR